MPAIRKLTSVGVILQVLILVLTILTVSICMLIALLRALSTRVRFTLAGAIGSAAVLHTVSRGEQRLTHIIVPATLRPGEVAHVGAAEDCTIHSPPVLDSLAVQIQNSKLEKIRGVSNDRRIHDFLHNDTSPSTTPMVGAPFARLIANVIVMGGGVLGRAFLDAYKQALSKRLGSLASGTHAICTRALA
jgi:hypothetical protein